MVKHCNRCGRPYSGTVAACPECSCPEFSLDAGTLTAGWKRRQKVEPKKKSKTLPESKQPRFEEM